MKKTVNECINGCTVSDPTRLVGIEIEAENVRKCDTLQWWNIKEDHSLRNSGREFVTRPIKLNEVQSALKEYYKVSKEYNYKSTIRTSQHTHIDCRTYTVENIKTCAGTYALLEPLFFHQVPKEREECIYCVPWYRADSDVKELRKLLNNKQGLDHIIVFLRERVCKYSAFYLEPLGRFGTVEFRHAPTWSNWLDAEKWINMCWSMVEFASKYTPQQILDSFETLGPRRFARQVVGNYASIPYNYEDLFEYYDVEILGRYLLEQPKPTKKPEKWSRTTVEVNMPQPTDTLDILVGGL